MQNFESSEAEAIIKKNPSLSQLFHHFRNHGAEKVDEARLAKNCDSPSPSPCRPRSNSSPTQDPSAFSASAIERDEIAGLKWQVTHLRYPRETETISSLQIKWVAFGKIKLPKIFFQQKNVEKQEGSVNYDLFCSQMESLLNEYAKKGFHLFSITPTHSGFSSIVSTAPRPQPHFFKLPAAKTTLRGEEAFILIFRKS